MPIYEYRCRACGFELEKLQKISEEPLRECPGCGKLELQKLVSAAGFRLSGGGWYETDFKSKNRKNLAKAEKKPAADSKTSSADKKKQASGSGK